LVLESFKDDVEVCFAISNFYDDLNNSHNLFNRISYMFNHINEYDTKQVYIVNNSSLANLSIKLYGGWNVINNALEYYYNAKIDINSSKTQAAIKRKDNWLKQEYFSIYFIDDVIRYCVDNQQLEQSSIQTSLVKYFSQIFTQPDNYIMRITNQYNTFQKLMQNIQPDTKNLIQEKDNVTEIKKLLDLIMELQHLCKLFVHKLDISDKDQRFYSELEYCTEHLNPFVKLYNQTRNYLTQKPYSLEKIKLNFENAALLSGWDRNKETANTSILLRKGGNYYLGIMNKKHNKIFETFPSSESNNNYEKIVYKLLPGANKMLPKVFLSTKGKETFKPSQNIIDGYNNDRHKKGNNFDLNYCHKLIDYFKDSIKKHIDWKNFNFNFSDTNTYEDISNFYREVESQGYKITFDLISEQYINKLIDESKLYLFQIYNKDFSPYSKGLPNIHTMYWKALFSEENLANVVYKLNGQAEIFYRKKSITADKTIKHPANQSLKNKNIDNVNKQSIFEYDLIKDKRFTMDKFQFHIPITLNFKASGRDEINLEVREYLKTNNDTYVIGIDRGERHLLYISVINSQSKIIEQFSLNEIINENKGNTYKVNYHYLLNNKESNRKKAREDWGVIENIKELKDGYLSQVVHKICKLVVKYQAIIVMEDLNSGFKNSRIKVEKQVYQKFEKMLIDKLQFLFFKNPQENQPSIYNSLQLSSKFKTFKDLEKRKQSGFIFYVPAWNTSKIDPTTGFVDLLKPKYKTVHEAQYFINKFDFIKYNQSKDWFEFGFNYSRFTEKAEDTKLEWIVCTTNINRYSWDKLLNSGKGGQQIFEITKCLKCLFERYNINYKLEENIVPIISKQVEKHFFSSLLKYLAITLNLRHNNGRLGIEEDDYIASPVANKDGIFFDSRNELNKGKNQRGEWLSKLPIDADANGAYNIAKKGLLVLQQLRCSDDITKINLAISNKNWLKFAQAL
jgi:CRISPR-associated protein Cpf1